MSIAILTLTAALCLTQPPSPTNSPVGMLSNTDKGLSPALVAQQYRNSDPHGDDPHGGDPHDENHDLGLPAHSMARGKATDNVYGNAVDVRNTEHPLDNYPGQPGF